MLNVCLFFRPSQPGLKGAELLAAFDGQADTLIRGPAPEARARVVQIQKTAAKLSHTQNRHKS